jgi:uncharacterized protein
VSSYVPPPADGLHARWVDAHGAVAEESVLRWENEAWTVENTLVGLQTQAVMRVSAGWYVRQLLLFRDLPEPDLWLANDGAGRWGEVNGGHREDLDGCTDVAVADSVTAVLPALRRLPLHIGHGAEVRVAVIDPDTLAVVPATWRLSRLDEALWEVDTASTTQRVAFEVDRYGLPLDVGDQRRRVMPDDR